MDLIAIAYDSENEDEQFTYEELHNSLEQIGKQQTTSSFKEHGGKKLPAAYDVLQAKHQIHLDIPVEHNHRIRSFPHEKGNWSSFVYIPWKISDEVLDFVTGFKDYSKENIVLCHEFHVSLTKTLVLRHHWIEGFLESIRKSVEGIPRFKAFLYDMDVFINEEQTCTFLGFQVYDPLEMLANITEKLDSCLAEYNLPSYYENPYFHVSVAWCLGNKKTELKHLLNSYQHHLNISSDCEVSELLCKIGHMYFKCPLL